MPILFNLNFYLFDSCLLVVFSAYLPIGFVALFVESVILVWAVMPAVSQQRKMQGLIYSFISIQITTTEVQGNQTAPATGCLLPINLLPVTFTPQIITLRRPPDVSTSSKTRDHGKGLSCTFLGLSPGSWNTLNQRSAI